MFDDIDLGNVFRVSTTPAIYLSFFGPDSAMMENAAHITARLLMVSGNNDPTQRNADNIFAHVPLDPRNRHVTLKADHLDTPAASVAAILSWLKILPHSGLDQ